MNQQKAKQLRRMVNTVYGNDLHEKTYGARKNSPKNSFGTIELGQCIRKAYQTLKKEYKQNLHS